MRVHPPALDQVHSWALDRGVDLLDVWERGGFLFDHAGEGVTGSAGGISIELPPGPDQGARASAEAERLLAALSGSAAGEAVAVGALPYDGGIAARISIPDRTVRRRHETVCEIEIGAGTGEGLGRHAETSSQARPPSAPREEPSAEVYAQAVAGAVARIGRGELRKVVLARTLVVDAEGLDIRAVLARARHRDPGCCTFAVPNVGTGGSLLIGATPELLIRRRGSQVTSTPLGGSARRSTDPVHDREAAQRLLVSAKDRREHALVVEAVTDSLAPYCTDLSVVDGFQISATADMWHLGSSVRGTLRSSAPSALGLAAALHPTPAICGTPRPAALAAIRELEPVSRGLYSGIVGWVDARGDGEWFVALRCAEITAGGARLFAGAGVVEGSVPTAEVAETRAKFAALLEALTVHGV